MATSSYDDTNDLTSLSYAKGGTTWAAFTQAADIFGQVRSQSSPESSQDFTYDGAARLSGVVDSGDGVVIGRRYCLDADSNRTAAYTYSSGALGSCASPGSSISSSSHSYDEADRVTDAGYAYDNLGRTNSVPAADVTGGGSVSMDYFANDMVHRQSQGAHSKTWTLDPSSRLLAETDSVSGLTSTNRYADSSDAPAWISVSDGTWSRNVLGLGGDLAVIQSSAGTAQVELTNPHGDVVMTVDDTSSAAVPNTYRENTEFGVSRQFYDDQLAASQGATINGTVVPATVPARYGWLGGKRRSSDAIGGVVLMGVRLYDPARGRFLSRDPVPGGNPNAYVYPVDPVRHFDISGRCDRSRTTHCGAYGGVMNKYWNEARKWIDRITKKRPKYYAYVTLVSRMFAQAVATNYWMEVGDMGPNYESEQTQFHMGLYNMYRSQVDQASGFIVGVVMKEMSSALRAILKRWAGSELSAYKQS